MTNPESRELRLAGGAWLKALREERRLTQRDVGLAINFRYYTHWAQIESGIGRVSADRYHLLAAALGVDAPFLVRTLMSFYDPETFRRLFDAGDIDPARMVLSEPLGAPRPVPAITAADARELRAEAGRWLRDRREERGLTQTQLAQALGYKFYTRVSQIERGIGRVPPEDYGRYAAALGVPERFFVETLLRCYDPLVHHLAYGKEAPGRAANALLKQG